VSLNSRLESNKEEEPGGAFSWRSATIWLQPLLSGAHFFHAYGRILTCVQGCLAHKKTPHRAAPFLAGARRPGRGRSWPPAGRARSLSLSLSLSMFLSVSVCLCVCLSVSVSLSISLSLSPHLSPTFSWRRATIWLRPLLAARWSAVCPLSFTSFTFAPDGAVHFSI